ncbi:MAG: SGNH/GDSL hydrolase family protein [Erythrobacter sp.]|nr:SGNH/GDSL hydrolase family protein [Erythrobacter sp.]
MTIAVIKRAASVVIKPGENAAEAARQAAIATEAAASIADTVSDLASDTAQVFINGTVFWDRSDRKLDFPEITGRLRSSGSSFTTWTPPAGTTWEATMPSSGSGLVYIDTTVAAGSNPIKVGASLAVITQDATKIPLGYWWQRNFVGHKGYQLQETWAEDRRVQHVASNLSIVFVPAADAGTYGLTTGSQGSWMVPLTLRYVVLGMTVSTIANTASAVVDPTGSYTWSNYAQVDVNNAAENSLWLNVGTNTVSANSRTGFMRGTNSGIVPLAVRHSANGRVRPLAGVQAFTVGKDPDALFDRVSTNEAAIAAMGTNIPALSSGERLRRTLKKLAIIADGGTAVVRICAGPADSWWDRPYAGTELLERFAADGIAMSSSGYINLNPSFAKSNGVVLTQSDGSTALNTGPAGWTHEDADTGSGNGQLSGSGNALSTTDTDRTFLATGIKAETIHLTYHDTGTGAFRYRTNGGSWTTVTMLDSGDALRIQVASGLSGSANTVEIDTTVNTAGQTVRLLDMYADGTAAGVQFNQMANAASTALDWDGFKDAWIREVTDMDVDLAIFALGVNDQGQGTGVITPATFGALLQGMLDDFNAVLPNSQVLLLSPPRVVTGNSGGTVSMQDFGAQYSALYVANEFTELVRYDTLWGSYEEEMPLRPRSSPTTSTSAITRTRGPTSGISAHSSTGCCRDSCEPLNCPDRALLRSASRIARLS